MYTRLCIVHMSKSIDLKILVNYIHNQINERNFVLGVFFDGLQNNLITIFLENYINGSINNKNLH
ncbi:hypothetical protein FWK35_00035849, partial [Aphis craccivora]